MAADISASIIPLHQPKAKTAAERQRACRARKRQNAVTPATVTAVTPAVTSRVTAAVTGIASANPASRRPLAPMLLTIAALGLAVVGICMNGSFAHGLGASELSGTLFLAIGVAADLCALAVPSCAASLWHAHRRGAAAAAWAIWTLTFAFTVTAGLGFASVNITDVTAARASRVTPAIETARASLSDAMTSRDRECSGGVGKNCRAREDAVTDRRRALDAAMQAVEQTADPQTQAAIRVVAWLSAGQITPSGNDFAMLRLILLALFPQIGGVLLMVARNTKGNP